MSGHLGRLCLTAFIGLTLTISLGVSSQAQDRKSMRKHRVVLARRMSPVVADRALTIVRPPSGPYPEPYVGGDPNFLGQNDEDVYGTVANFNPVPPITSGVQYPYGLDGAGGYGDNLGFEAGQSEQTYQRGP